jgi:hypothetical protein
MPRQTKLRMQTAADCCGWLLPFARLSQQPPGDLPQNAFSYGRKRRGINCCRKSLLVRLPSSANILSDFRASACRHTAVAYTRTLISPCTWSVPELDRTLHPQFNQQSLLPTRQTSRSSLPPSEDSAWKKVTMRCSVACPVSDASCVIGASALSPAKSCGNPWPDATCC